MAESKAPFSKNNNGQMHLSAASHMHVRQNSSAYMARSAQMHLAAVRLISFVILMVYFERICILERPQGTTYLCRVMLL